MTRPSPSTEALFLYPQLAARKEIEGYRAVYSRGLKRVSLFS